MYVDCPLCGFESDCFTPLAPNIFEQAKAAIEKHGGTIEQGQGEWIFKCPQGHVANYLPSELKFCKNRKK